jgi:hypothetical protein
MISDFITRLFRWKQTVRIKRFECLLPTKYNDGTEIEPAKYDLTDEELSQRFEGLSQDIVKVKGIWKFAGLLYQDELVRIRIDSGDRAATSFLTAYKET